MCPRMQHKKRKLKLIGANQFFGESANRVGVKLRIGRREIDQVIRVCEDGGERGSLRDD